MVTDGGNEKHIKVNFDGDRIRLPAKFAVRAGFIGDNPIDCWLLVVTPGRYRLVTRSAASTEDLSRILRQIEEAGQSGKLLDLTDSNAHAAIQTRLIPTVLAPTEGAWRVTIPEVLRELVPKQEERSFVFVMMVAGFVELWFPDTLRRADSVPLSDILL